MRIIEYEKEKRCTCTLYVTEACNLNCIYCYEHKKGTAILSLELAQKAIQATFCRALEQNVSYVEILFHGGEPFMAFERVREICEWLWNQEWPVRYICYATTNGTLIHGEIKRWLLDNKERFFLGLSLDGTPSMQNRNRSNSYDKIDVDFFIDNWPEQGVKMTPSPGTLEHLTEGIIYIHDIGFKRNNCSFASGIDWEHDENGDYVAYKEILTRELMKLTDYYLEHKEIMPIDMINMKLLAIAVGIKNLTDKLCGAGTIMRCWTPDGQCLPCHLFYEVSKVRGKKLPQIDLSKSLELSDPRCQGCILEPVCPTCYGGNYITYEDVSKRDPYTCEITKIRAFAASRLIGNMLQNPQEYIALRDMKEDELAMTTKGVIMIQQLMDN